MTIIVYTEVKLRKTDRIMPLLIKALLYKLSSNFVDFFFVDLVSFTTQSLVNNQLETQSKEKN